MIFLDCTFIAVLVKDPAVRARRASLCRSPIKSSVELNLTVATILLVTGGPPNVQRHYREPIRLDATRALR